MSRWLTEEALSDHLARMRGLERRPVSQARAEVVDTEPTTRRSVTLVLPMPPTLNHSSMPNGRGGRYLTAEHRNYREIVRLELMKMRAPKLVGRLKAAMVLFPADRRRFDIDNRGKAAFDALQLGGLFDDDEQIDQLEIIRVRGTKRGEAAITITEL
jgi:crossover junction endodeoxyribonuclease RusA